MRCLDCKTELKVLRTTTESHEVIRRRECRLCGRRFTTRERFVGDSTELGAISTGQLAASIGELLNSLGMASNESVRNVLRSLTMSESTRTTNFGEER